MEIAMLSHHTMCECGCCGELFIVKHLSPEESGDYVRSSDELHERLRKHQNESPKCKAWHDNLPTLLGLKGIDITGGMDSAEYVRKLRDGRDDDAPAA